MYSIVSELDFQSLSSLMWSMCDLEINELFTAQDCVECLKAWFYTEEDIKAALNPQGHFIFEEEKYEQDEALSYSDEAIVARMLNNDLHYGEVLPSFVDESFTLTYQDIADHAAIELMQDLSL